MKCLCITGQEPRVLQAVFNALQPAGLAPATPARDDPRSTLDHWHGEVLRLLEENDGSIENMGRFWDHLATETFAANMQQPLWGWADPRSARVLDYWIAYEPRLFFLLAYTDPADAMAVWMSSDAPADQLQTQLQTWEDQHRAMLHAFHSHPRRCLLVSASEALANPQALAAQLAELFGLPLNPGAASKAGTDTAPDALAAYLANQLLADYPELSALHRELQASAQPLTAGQTSGIVQEHDFEWIVSSYRKLRDRSADLASLALAREQFERLSQTLQPLKVEADQSRVKLEEQQGLLIQTQEKYQVELKEMQEENDLLLTQLHQVQEELEAWYLKHKDSEVKLATATKAWDEQAKLAQERHAHLEQLSKDKEALAKLASDGKIQLEQVTKARDEQTKLAADRKAQLDALKSEKDETDKGMRARQVQIDQLTTTQDQLQQQLQQACEDVEAWQAGYRDDEGRRKELQLRNDLLLMQMHQMQDELARLFESDQQLRQELRVSERRIQDLLEGSPGLNSARGLQLCSMDANGSVHWRMSNVGSAGRILPTVEFTTTLHSSGMAGIGFTRNKQGKSPLLRWPAQTLDDTLWLLPAGDKQQLRAAIALLVDLGPSDWLMLKALLAKLQEELRQAPPAEVSDAAALCAGLARLSQLLQSLPAVLRYDQLQLKRAQVNPDYEHLWLQFSNFSWGEQVWPSFEFRLSCAQVTPSSFGLFPKLEFPQEGGKAPFITWFIEAEDDFGAKLELRYNLPESLDVVVWGKLDASDKEFISLLVQHLLLFLGQLEASGTTLERPWQDWQLMVLVMQEVTVRFVAPSARLEAPVAPEHIADPVAVAVPALLQSTKVGQVAPKAVATTRAKPKAKAMLRAKAKPAPKAKAKTKKAAKA